MHIIVTGGPKAKEVRGTQREREREGEQDGQRRSEFGVQRHFAVIHTLSVTNDFPSFFALSAFESIAQETLKRFTWLYG